MQAMIYIIFLCSGLDWRTALLVGTVVVVMETTRIRHRTYETFDGRHVVWQ